MDVAIKIQWTALLFLAVSCGVAILCKDESVAFAVKAIIVVIWIASAAAILAATLYRIWL